MIAIALACDPQLLIADEPTTALDVMVQAQILRLLDRSAARARARVLFITHDLSMLAARLPTGSRSCTPAASSRRARRASVFDGAAHPYTRALAAAFPVIGDPAFRRDPSGLAGDPPDPRELPRGCPFHPRCPVARAELPPTEVELWPARGRRAGCVEAARAWRCRPGALEA